MRIEIESNLEKKILAFTLLKSRFQEVRKIALSSSSYLFMVATRKYIETAGNGAWELHPLSRQYFKHYGKGKRWLGHRSRRLGGPYEWLGKFARYEIYGGRQAKIGFGKFRQRDVRKGRPLRLDRNLERVAYNIQRGRRVRVKDKIRRLFAARGRPISRKTVLFDIKPRPIMLPVFTAEEQAAKKLFEETFNRVLLKRFEKL